MSLENIEKNKERVLWVGYSPDNQNDFGRYASQLLPLLTEKYDLTLFAIENHFTTSSEVGYNLIEAGDNTGLLGFQKLINVINVNKPHHLILFNYPHIVISYINNVIRRGLCNLDNTQVLGFLAIDYINLIHSDVQSLNILDGVLVPTLFAKEQLEKMRFQKPIHILPAGVSPCFMNLGKSKEKLRKDLSSKIGKNTFIFYCGMENIFENRLDILLDGYTSFLKEQIDNLKSDDKLDVCLMLGCGMIDRGWDIAKLMETMCIEKGIVTYDSDSSEWEKYLLFSLPNPQNGHPNFKNEYLNLVYNCVDVGLSTSSGQFWGFSNFDMASVGVPQIVPNFAGQGEIFNENTLMISPETFYRAPYMMDASMGTRGIISSNDLTMAMTTIYTNNKIYEKASKKAKLLVSRFTWNKSLMLLEKAFNEIKVIRNQPIEVKINNNKGL